jgi:hypothetical protein
LKPILAGRRSTGAVRIKPVPYFTPVCPFAVHIK